MGNKVFNYLSWLGRCYTSWPESSGSNLTSNRVHSAIPVRRLLLLEITILKRPTKQIISTVMDTAIGQKALVTSNESNRLGYIQSSYQMHSQTDEG